MIFLDSSFIIALINKKDKYHEKAVKLMMKTGHEKKMVNNIVIVEVLNVLNKRNKPEDLNYILDYLNKLDKIHYLNHKNFINSVKIFKYFNYSINFADCTIIDTMLSNKINIIMSFDSDFDKVNGIYRISKSNDDYN